MGSDLTVVNAARVSFDKESRLDLAGSLSEKDAKLIHYLAKHDHFTPFTHPQITLRETVPIFVARQRFKHVVGFSYNEVSRRYVDDTPEFFMPKIWRSRPEGSVKQGSGSESVELITHDEVRASPHSHYMDFLARAIELYQDMLRDGVAPE